MGIRLMVEILDHAPPTLTDKEVRALLAIAEKANDRTRLGWPGLRLICHRASISVRRVRDVIARLVLKGVLEIVREARGRGNPAVYRVVDLVALAAERAATPPPPPARLHENALFELEDLLYDCGDVATVTAVPADAEPKGDTSEPKGDTEEGKGDAESAGAAAQPHNPHGPLMEPSPPRARRAPARKADVTKTVASAIAEATGWTGTTKEWAQRVLAHVVAEARTPVAHPAAYARTVILNDPNPRRFLPTSHETRAPSAGGECGHGDPRGPHACALCRAGRPAYAA